MRERESLATGIRWISGGDGMEFLKDLQIIEYQFAFPWVFFTQAPKALFYYYDRDKRYHAFSKVLLVQLQALRQPIVFLEAAALLEKTYNPWVFFVTGFYTGTVINEFRFSLAHRSFDKEILMSQPELKLQIIIYFPFLCLSLLSLAMALTRRIQQFEMSMTEEQLISIELPLFLNNFKDKCLGYTIPFIDSSIEYVTKSENSLFFILILLLFLQLLRVALTKKPQDAKQAENSTEQRQISKEIKDLKKEMKSIQTMMLQLKSVEKPIQPLSQSVENSEQTRRLIESCRNSWEKREEVASEIMDWQVKIIKEVTKLKNRNKSSRSPSKINVSNNKMQSAQSKKSTTSAIISPPQQHQKPIFQSEIKPNNLPSAISEESLSQQVEETIVQVKIEKRPVESQVEQQINVQVHEVKTAKDNLVVQTIESVSITQPIENINDATNEGQENPNITIVEQRREIVRPVPRKLPGPPPGVKRIVGKPPAGRPKVNP